MSTDPLTSACASAAPRMLLVVTGAGVSLASGISTFRGTDPGAVWSVDVTELGTISYFHRDPVGSWQWYLRRFGALHDARPNPAHLALAALERWHVGRGGEFLLVTQNVDGLHEQAGTSALVHVHGRADRVRCSSHGCVHGAPKGCLPRDPERDAAFLREPGEATLPRCPACDAPLRQHVLWFDEYYTGHRDYEIERVLKAAKQAAVVLFVGTSFAVGITDLILTRALARNAKVFALDPVARYPHPSVVPVVAAAEERLPALCRALGAA
ncbi:SIR2 family NAD-dependent protein deacylase [Nannocystis radixulma]|uniref:protein acetyllysine N-acetyltransferase n=1 Tax=Nannocystis radixulma TaxID=2995305 RepID=A0ABT5BK67_9BACT|nr:Sir2 family NAD-dependent protein deacetylase [Nannocystis radixulma]MDC0673990.1 RNA polymerase subunit sigma [Nannocystis radixulma]